MGDVDFHTKITNFGLQLGKSTTQQIIILFYVINNELRWSKELIKINIFSYRRSQGSS